MAKDNFSKVLIGTIVVGVVILVLGIWLFLQTEPEYPVELGMESDAMAVVNYYHPKRIELRKEPSESNLVLPELRSAEPLYGRLEMGNSDDPIISILLDETHDQGISFLYIDKNNNEDFTDDDEATWDEVKRDYMIKEVLIDVAYNGIAPQTVPYPVSFYRYKNRLKDSIVAFRNGYREGKLAINDTVYRLAIFDDNLDGLFDEMDKGAIVIDLNLDGALNGKTDSDEYFSLKNAFAFGQETLRIKHISPAGDLLTFAAIDSFFTPRQTLSQDLDAPVFRSLDINGNLVDFEKHKNKVVLIDFWATWCKPWEEELGALKKDYERYHSRGFDIIGMSLDYEVSAVSEYVRENNIDWPQIADGNGWYMSFVDVFKVDALPRNFLIDKNGVIRYKNLYGKNLSSKIYELLVEPEVE